MAGPAKVQVVPPPKLKDAKWSKASAKPGEKVTLEVTTENTVADQWVEFRLQVAGALEEVLKATAKGASHTAEWAAPNPAGTVEVTFDAVLREKPTPKNGHETTRARLKSGELAIQGFGVVVTKSDPTFIPKQEKLEVTFTVADADGAAKAGRYEVWGERYPSDKPLYTEDFVPKAGETVWSAWDGKANDGVLKDKHLPVRYSPYRVRVILGPDAAAVKDPSGAGRGKVAIAEARVRVVQKIVLRVGPIEDLFADAPDTASGRMARLQTLGLFYFPLTHAHARIAFDGSPATPAIPATGHPGNQAFTGAWSYFKSDIVAGKTALNPATDAEADAEVQTRLTQFIVAGGTLPAPIADGAAPDAAVNFRKIRAPGGFTFVNANSGLDGNRDPLHAMGMTDSQFAVEDLYYRDNPVLGKIPIEAALEGQNRRGDFESVKEKDVAIYCQLLPADPLPAYAPAQPANDQINRPNLRQSHQGSLAIPAIGGFAAEPVIVPLAVGVGPRLRYTTEEALKPDATDPQGTNCHQDYGGKRGRGNVADGSNVANVIFETTSRPGFNAKHPARALPHKDYPVAQQVAPDGESHKHAVKALTNEDGRAGVIFMPSRMGGDRYKLRAYLGPTTLPSDGTDVDAVKTDTGTLVVWRNLRLSRYCQVVPGDPDPALLANVSNPATYNITTNNAYRTRVGVENAAPLSIGNWSAVEGVIPPAFAGPIVMWARAWCEFEIDRNALTPFTDAEYTAARNQALADGMDGQAVVGSNYNLRNLLWLDAAAPALTPATGLTCVPMRTAESYNAMRTTLPAQRIAVQPGFGSFGANPAHQRRVENLHLNYLLPGFTRSLSRNGHLPGITVIQSAMGCTWQLIGQNGDFSGIAMNFRACHLWYGSAVYVPARFPYGYDSNMTHEMGHCHHREHAPGRNANRTPAGGNKVAKHDALATSICVMSYKNCEGDLCGMCTIGLRGWDIAPMHP